jgi:hypothetical protein
VRRLRGTARKTGWILKEATASREVKQSAAILQASELRYFIKCGATRLINSRGVMILVFFQNFGKCF